MVIGHDMAKVYFRGNRRQAIELTRRVLASLTGQTPDSSGIARGVFTGIGLAALTTIKREFAVKSRGGTDSAGVKWHPLSKEYIAYKRRFGPGERAALKKAAGLGPGHRHGIGGNRGLLSADQKKQWQQIFGTRLARLSLSMPIKEAKELAARIAWATMKRRGAKTMLETFGNRQVEILKDTGVMFKSLSPGEMHGVTYSPPPDQVFDLLANGVIVGTTVPYATFHQHGTGKRHRPFLPEGDVPEAWEDEWLVTGLDALEIGMRQAFNAGPGSA